MTRVRVVCACVCNFCQHVFRTTLAIVFDPLPKTVSFVSFCGIPGTMNDFSRFLYISPTLRYCVCHPSLGIHLSIHARSSPALILARVVSLVLSLQLFAFSTIQCQPESVLCWIALRMGKDKAFAGCGLQVASFRFSDSSSGGSTKQKLPQNATFFRRSCRE